MKKFACLALLGTTLWGCAVQDAPVIEPTVPVSGAPAAPTAPATPAEPAVKGAAWEAGARPDPSGELVSVAAVKPKEGEEVAVLETAQGRIVVMFFPDIAPRHVERFKECVREGIYNGVYFHRVIPGFMIQGGDPNTKNADRADDGGGGHGAMLKAEFNNIKHETGVLSAARTGDPNSAQSQFFICVANAPNLDRQYTAFGKVVVGQDVATKIVNLPRDQADNPNDSKAATIKTARLTTWPVE